MLKLTLMNKDVEVIEFSIERTQYALNILFDSDAKSPLPLGMRDFRVWLESRYIMQYRVKTLDFFRSIGVENIEDFILITHCVSLLDSYWVKRRGSRLSWKSISLYRNSLNSAVANYSFNRVVSGKVLCSPSPDFSTDGNFPKCWVMRNGNLYLYKAGSSGARNAGNEPYSEIYASKIARVLGISHVEYVLGNHKGVLVSKCRCMCNEELGFTPYNIATGIYEADFATLLKGYNYSREILDMLLLDYVTCNVDRHYGNFGFIVNNYTQKVVSPAPLYDNNLSCIPYYMEDESLEYYINDIRAKDGTKFSDLYRMIDCKYVREKLKLLQGKDFGIGCKRDKVVNGMIKYQIESATKRI